MFSIIFDTLYLLINISQCARHDILVYCIQEEFSLMFRLSNVSPTHFMLESDSFQYYSDPLRWHQNDN